MNPDDIKYHREHAWVRVEGKNATIGITDFAQQQLGDIVYVDLPEAGTEVDGDSELANRIAHDQRFGKGFTRSDRRLAEYEQAGRHPHRRHIDQRTVRREHDAALLWLRTQVEECRTPPRFEALFSSSSSTPTRDVGTALRRQEQLTDALESWMDARAERLCEIEQCMDGNCPTPTHRKRNNLDQWEMVYLAKHGRRSMGTADYDAKRLEEFCAQCATHWTWDGGCERRTC